MGLAGVLRRQCARIRTQLRASTVRLCANGNLRARRRTECCRNDRERRFAAVGLKNVKAYNSIIHMLGVACAGLILNACETTWPGAASAPPYDSRQALGYGDPTFGNDLERLPNPAMLRPSSSLVIGK